MRTIYGIISGFMYVLSMIAVTTSANAKDTPPNEILLARTGKWELNYDTESCHLFGTFGQGAQTTMLNITRYQPGDAFDFTLYGDVAKPQGIFSNGVAIAFGSFPASQPYGYNGYTTSKLPLISFSSLRFDGWEFPSKSNEKTKPPQISPADEATITFISLRNRKGDSVRLETGSLGIPMEGMRACLDDLVTSWGFDPTVQNTLSQKPSPKGSPGNWARGVSYPKEALLQEKSGILTFRLDIDETGKTTNCHILHRTEPDLFAEKTCQILMRRAKFKPALDRAGRPVRSFWISRFNWFT